MIAYRDFAPGQVSAPALMKPATYESLDQALAAANAWIRSNAIEVLSVETVVLPNLWTPHSEGTISLQTQFAPYRISRQSRRANPRRTEAVISRCLKDLWQGRPDGQE
jgi:hypothetical protein